MTLHYMPTRLGSSGGERVVSDPCVFVPKLLLLMSKKPVTATEAAKELSISPVTAARWATAFVVAGLAHCSQRERQAGKTGPAPVEYWTAKTLWGCREL